MFKKFIPHQKIASDDKDPSRLNKKVRDFLRKKNALYKNLFAKVYIRSLKIYKPNLKIELNSFKLNVTKISHKTL